MKTLSITCGNNKEEMEKVAYLVYKNFRFKPFIGKHNKKDMIRYMKLVVILY